MTNPEIKKFFSLNDLYYYKYALENEVFRNKIKDLENEIKNLKKEIHDPLNNSELNSNEDIQGAIDNIYDMYLSTKSSTNIYMQMLSDLQKCNSIL